MRYKFLTLEQIILIFDRLTRVKNTKDKYIRVFTDIIVSCLCEPKLQKKNFLENDYKTLKTYASEIINASLENISKQPLPKINKNINQFISDYENSIYINDSETQILLDNDINYNAVINLIDNPKTVNLMWLKTLNKSSGNTKQNRKKMLLKYPLEKIILVEGITEECLLPAFSQFLGYDFYAEGIHVIGAGGKNQVVKMYYQLTEELKLPIFILLDKDAEENISQIKPKLRSKDKIHIVSCGEFEDLLPKSLIVKTINNHFQNFLHITENDITENMPMVKILEELFKIQGLHEFKKAEFARLIKENISEKSDISQEISNIVTEIKN